MNTELNNSKAVDFEIRQSDDDTAELWLTAAWSAGYKHPDPQEIFEKLSQKSPTLAEVHVIAESLQSFDMSLPTFVFALNNLCRNSDIVLKYDRLPDAAKRLLDLANAVPEQAGVRRKQSRTSFLTKVGAGAIETGSNTQQTLAFIGDSFMSHCRLLTGKAQFRWSDLLLVIQDCGPRALPIVTLIGFLMGLILAFVGAIQLKMIGAEIFVADLVGIGIVRALGAIMAGIVMAGRTGASFAAELGTMQVNEETDALKTLGISPIDFLVLPRMLGLTLMMPLLCLYADLVGILGGLVVGVGVLNLPAKLYINQSIQAVNLTQVWIGVFMSFTFGILISLAGCKEGINCGRSSSSVGTATNAAVVKSIVYIVVATAVITVTCSLLGI